MILCLLRLHLEKGLVRKIHDAGVIIVISSFRPIGFQVKWYPEGWHDLLFEPGVCALADAQNLHAWFFLGAS